MKSLKHNFSLSKDDDDDHHLYLCTQTDEVNICLFRHEDEEKRRTIVDDGWLG